MPGVVTWSGHGCCPAGPRGSAPLEDVRTLLQSEGGTFLGFTPGSWKKYADFGCSCHPRREEAVDTSWGGCERFSAGPNSCPYLRIDHESWPSMCKSVVGEK